MEKDFLEVLVTFWQTFFSGLSVIGQDGLFAKLLRLVGILNLKEIIIGAKKKVQEFGVLC